MMQRYQDAMALLHVGKPDLFITKTCNPSWPEIQALLLPGQKAQDRPDITGTLLLLFYPYYCFLWSIHSIIFTLIAFHYCHHHYSKSFSGETSGVKGIFEHGVLGHAIATTNP